MNNLFESVLKTGRKLYSIVDDSSSSALFGRNWKLFSNKEYSNQLIYDTLLDSAPCMIARFGSTEMRCLLNYWGVQNQNESKSVKKFVMSKTPPWWWEKSIIEKMQNYSGFFPSRIDQLEKYCELMLKDITEVDILGSWLYSEDFFQQSLSSTKRVVLEDLEPFFANNPWTKALKGKKVLVIHPFAETIEEQYQKRDLIFKDEMLPLFELSTIKAVQSVAGNETEFESWFEALDYMKAQMDQIDYDICIIGCGAYGFPLAAHAKRKGKKGIHLGGVTQLLFGIIGKRWETNIVWPYMNLFNEHWVRPGQNEKPKNAKVVEGACYW